MISGVKQSINCSRIGQNGCLNVLGFKKFDTSKTKVNYVGLTCGLHDTYVSFNDITDNDKLFLHSLIYPSCKSKIFYCTCASLISDDFETKNKKKIRCVSLCMEEYEKLKKKNRKRKIDEISEEENQKLHELQMELMAMRSTN